MPSLIYSPSTINYLFLLLWFHVQEVTSARKRSQNRIFDVSQLSTVQVHLVQRLRNGAHLQLFCCMKCFSNTFRNLYSPPAPVSDLTCGTWCQRHFILPEATKEILTHFLSFCQFPLTLNSKISCECNCPAPPPNGLWFKSSFPFCFLFINEKDACDSERTLLSKWPLTHYLYSQQSLTFTLPLTFSTFTCPCASSVYCNRIQHVAPQATDKPAQGQLPTLAPIINRLFTQAYQSLYPLRMCVRGSLWTLCSLHRNRSPV